MIKARTWAALGAAALCLSFASPGQAGGSPARTPAKHAAAAKYYLRAQIIPAEATAIGNYSLTGGSAGVNGGESLWANGLGANWSTGDYTVDFVVLVFSSQAEVGNVEFKVVAPDQAVVYSHSYPSDHLYRGTTWFTIAVKADYSAAGVYFAEWYLGSALDGWAPLNFSA